MTEKADKKDKIVVLNRGLRTFTTSAGPLPPGGSIELGAKEAAVLLDYNGEVVDADKAMPEQARTLRALKAENKALRAELAKLAKPHTPHKADKPEVKADKPEVK